MKCVARTHVGLRRALNEDAFLVMGCSLFGVADGMGGHNAGEVASGLTAESIKNRLKGKTVSQAALLRAIDETNCLLLRHAKEHPECAGMGTTLTLFWMGKEGQALVAQIGDSRAYRLRGGVFTRITQDHSVVEELLLQGVITPEEARVHPYRNVITRALGAASLVDADLYHEAPQPGDLYLLCSDGLTGMVDEEAIASTLTQLAPAQAADALIQMALDAGGSDNITLLILTREEGVCL